MKPRILMVISLYHPCLGGAERQALELARRLQALQYPVEVLTRRLRGLPDRETVQGVPVHRGIRTVPWRTLFGAVYLLSACWELFRKRKSYDIIHCHELRGFHVFAALLMKRLFGKKVFVKVACSGRDSDFAVMRHTIPGRLLFNRLHAVDRLITLCRESTDEALSWGFPASRISCIPNGVDTQRFRPPAEEARRRGGIIFVGSLVERKGVDTLLRAFQQLTAAGVQTHLDIAGGGPQREDLEALSDKLGISHRVSFHGPQERIEKLLSSSTIFVLPSRAEGLPNALLEAMACGLAVVATRVGGNCDIIRDGKNGLLVDCDAPGQLGTALKKLLGNSALCRTIGAVARKTVEEGFSIDHVAQAYIGLYHE